MSYQQGHTFTAETLTDTLLNAEFAAIEAAFSAAEYITHKKVRVQHTDLTETANGTAQDITLFTIPAGSLVFNALSYVETQFTGGAVATCTEALGDSDPDGLCKAHDVLGCGDTTWVQEGENGTDKGAYLWDGTARTHKFYATATDIKAQFTPDGAHNLAALTAGSLLAFVIYITLPTS